MASTRRHPNTETGGALLKGAEQRTGRARRRMVNALTGGSAQAALHAGRQSRGVAGGVAAMARTVVAAGGAAAAMLMIAPRVAQWARSTRPSRLTPARPLHAAASDDGTRGVAARSISSQTQGKARTEQQREEGEAAAGAAEVAEGAGMGGVSMEGGGSAGGVEGPGPMEVLARGLACIQANLGPWSVSDLTLGLAVIAKVTQKRPPPPPGGRVVPPASLGLPYLTESQRLLAHAEAVYLGDSATWSLQTGLPESAIVHAQWQPHNQRVRPAFVVCVDAQLQAVVVAVRGTSDTVDMLVNAGTFPHHFLGGKVHSGFLHAATHLLYETREHIDAALRAWHGMLVRRLLFVGHSLGAAVAILAGMMLRHETHRLHPAVAHAQCSHTAAMDAARGQRAEGQQGSRVGGEESEDLQEAAAEAVVGAGGGMDGVEVQCVGYGPPACMTLELAQQCSPYVTCVLAQHDLVPRFSLASVELLRQSICAFGWERAEAVVGWHDEDWQRLKAARDLLARLKALQSTAVGAAAAVQGSAVSAAAAVQQSAAGVAASVQQSPLVGAAVGAAGAVQSQAVEAAAAVQGAAVAVTGAAAGLGGKAQELQQVVSARVPGIVAEALPQGVVGILVGGKQGAGEESEQEEGKKVAREGGEVVNGRGRKGVEVDGAKGANDDGGTVGREGGQGGGQEKKGVDAQRSEVGGVEAVDAGVSTEGLGGERVEVADGGDEEGGGKVTTAGGETAKDTGTGGSEGGEMCTEVKGATQESADEKQQKEEFAPPLHPPGRLLMLCCDPPGCGHRPTTRKDVHPQRQFGVFPSHEEVASGAMRWQLVEVEQEAVREIVVSPWCISDHMPGFMGEGLYWLMAHMGHEDKAKGKGEKGPGDAEE